MEAVGEKDVPAVEVKVRVPEGFEVTGIRAPSGWQGKLEDGSLSMVGRRARTGRGR